MRSRRRCHRKTRPAIRADPSRRAGRTAICLTTGSRRIRHSARIIHSPIRHSIQIIHSPIRRSIQIIHSPIRHTRRRSTTVSLIPKHTVRRISTFMTTTSPRIGCPKTCRSESLSVISGIRSKPDTARAKRVPEGPAPTPTRNLHQSFTQKGECPGQPPAVPPFPLFIAVFFSGVSSYLYSSVEVPTSSSVSPDSSDTASASAGSSPRSSESSSRTRSAFSSISSSVTGSSSARLYW